MSPEQAETAEIAARFLLGELIKAATHRFKAQQVAYILMPKAKQEELLRDIADDMRAAVRKAVYCIAADNRMLFQANCAQVTFKDDGVKATLELANTDAAHALANCAGRSLLVVLEDGESYLNPGNSTAGDDDQKPLFDQSTEGH